MLRLGVPPLNVAKRTNSQLSSEILCGLGESATASLIGMFAANYLCVSPQHSLLNHSPAEMVGTITSCSPRALS